MKTLLFSLLLSAVTVSATDVTGKWSGTLEAKGEGPRPAYMVLKQERTKLTGTGGPDESHQHPLENGKVEGDRLTFEVRQGEATLNFDLTAKGDQIEGDIKGQMPDGQAKTAKILLKRVVEK